MISRSGTRTSPAASGVTKILREAGSGPVVTAGSVASGLERMFIIYPPLNFYLSMPSLRANGSRECAPDDRLREAIHSCPQGGGMDCFVACAPRNDGGGFSLLISSGLRVHSEPRAYPCVGIGGLGDIADDGDGIRAGGKDLRRALKLDAADRNQRDVADAFLPFGDPCNALRRETHRFQRGRKDRPEGDVVGLGAQRGRQFFVVMRGKPKRQAGVADRLEIGIGQILLAEVQMFGASLDRRAPVVIDDEFCRRALDDSECVANDLQRLGVLEILGAQLHRTDAKQCKARDLGDAVYDGIKAVRIRNHDTACQNGVPTTGVEGEAKSRASISPAS